MLSVPLGRLLRAAVMRPTTNARSPRVRRKLPKPAPPLLLNAFQMLRALRPKLKPKSSRNKPAKRPLMMPRMKPQLPQLPTALPRKKTT